MTPASSCASNQIMFYSEQQVHKPQDATKGLDHRILSAFAALLEFVGLFVLVDLLELVDLDKENWKENHQN